MAAEEVKAPQLTGAAVVGQNHKLAKSAIAECPEVEDAKPCKFFEVGGEKTPYCVGCYAFQLYPVRKSNWGGKSVTDSDGIIRLGTWKEITAEDYSAFMAGCGLRANGDEWVRPDFPTRKHFVISRGLEGMALYERMAANPNLLNLQVSVDIIKEVGKPAVQIPSDARLRELIKFDKVVLRFKTVRKATEFRGRTYDANVVEFTALLERLGLNPMRVLETPLRLGNHVYQKETPLEEFGWDSKAFLRCNSECAACPSSRQTGGENRVLGCAVTPAIIQMLQRVGNVEPVRVDREPLGKMEWTKLTVEAWKALGGTASLTDLYAKIAEAEPRFAQAPYGKVKVRQAVQRLGVQMGRAVWKMREADE